MDDTAHRIAPASPGDAAPEPAVVRAELDRILSSSTFHHAKHAQRFLRHIVETALAGRGTDLKEYTVGIEVFDKDASFDPRIDSIVRTEARRLRARLQDFYDAEKDGGDCRIVLRKGSYVPSFEPVVAPATVGASAPGEQPASGPKDPPCGTAVPVAMAVPAVKAVPAVATDSPQRRTVLDRRAGLIAAAVVGAVAVALLIARFLPERTSATSPASVVVLPFVNLSGADYEFLSDGITEEVINSLGRIPDLRVIGRASAFQFKGEKIDLREIGRRLGVRYVLEGSVKESVGRLRISVWLEDTATGFRDWSQTFERDVQDTWIVEREIAAAIANALGNTVGDKRSIDAHLAGAPPVVNSEAYQLYLKGRYFWNKSTAADIETGIKLFEEAIAKDPAYAPAYSGLAASYNALLTLTAYSIREYTAKIRAAATKALALDNTLGEAHGALAVALAREGSLAAAEREYVRAVELSPGSALSYRGYSHHLQRVGRLDDALAAQRRAVELDPVTAYQTQRLGEILYLMRRYEDAVGQYQNALALDANFGLARRGLGLTYLQQGDFARALAELERADELLGDPRTRAELAYGYAIAGNRMNAQAILHDFQRRAPNESVPAIALARAYLGLGDRDRAFEWLFRAVGEGELLSLSVDPTYEPLRDDPRFGELLSRIKLSESSLAGNN
jgi:TolB-like protein/Flp pilus assembly protein TadD